MDSHDNGDQTIMGQLLAFPTPRRSPVDKIVQGVEALIRSDRPRDIAFVATLLDNLKSGIKGGQIDGYAVTAALESLPLDVSKLGTFNGPRAS
jgi:hypothetical protein